MPPGAPSPLGAPPAPGPAPQPAELPPQTGNSLNGVPIPPAAPAEGPSAPDGGAPSAPDGGAPVAAPSSFTPNGTGPGPSVAVTQYNPKTGEYVTPDGHAYKQTNLVAPGSPKSWQDMLPT